MKATRLRHGWVYMFISHRPTLTLQLRNFDLFRTCRTSSFRTVAWQLARFQLTQRIARSLGDSWASCFTYIRPKESRPTSYNTVYLILACVENFVRHKSVFYKNGWTNRARFWHVSFLPPILHCVKRKFGYLQNKGTSLWISPRHIDRRNVLST